MSEAYMDALKRRGYNPYLILRSGPVKRDNSLKMLYGLKKFQGNSYNFEKTKLFKHSQRMPLKMLVSQTARRMSVQCLPSYCRDNAQPSVSPFNLRHALATHPNFSKKNLSATSFQMFLQNRSTQENRNFMSSSDLRYSVQTNNENLDDKNKQNMRHLNTVEKFNENIINVNPNIIVRETGFVESSAILIEMETGQVNDDVSNIPCNFLDGNTEPNDKFEMTNSPDSLLYPSTKLNRNVDGFSWAPLPEFFENVHGGNIIEEVENNWSPF